jgi:hypothetical protein
MQMNGVCARKFAVSFCGLMRDKTQSSGIAVSCCRRVYAIACGVNNAVGPARPLHLYDLNNHSSLKRTILIRRSGQTEHSYPRRPTAVVRAACMGSRIDTRLRACILLHDGNGKALRERFRSVRGEFKFQTGKRAGAWSAGLSRALKAWPPPAERVSSRRITEARG